MLRQSFFYFRKKKAIEFFTSIKFFSCGVLFFYCFPTQDDPFSSLDNEVGNYVFENCINKMLLKQKRTTILVTQKLQLVFRADKVSYYKARFVFFCLFFFSLHINNE
jgi:hypothetical protein